MSAALLIQTQLLLFYSRWLSMLLSKLHVLAMQFCSMAIKTCKATNANASSSLK
jgi:hypothetical protein